MKPGLCFMLNLFIKSLPMQKADSSLESAMSFLHGFYRFHFSVNFQNS
jgi:hypothetical protein